MVAARYSQSNADYTLFVKKSSRKIVVLIVYVDDIVVTGNDIGEISWLKNFLGKEFQVKDLGQLCYFLGIEVVRSSNGVYLSQRKYVLDLLSETGMLGCKTADSPIEVKSHLVSQKSDPVDKSSYQRLVGRLIYLSHTHPDIAYSVSWVNQYMHDPYSSHMDVVLCILQYLKSAPGRGILFAPHDHLRIKAYTDADWAGSPDDRRSTSDYGTFVGGNLVT
ncbi:uncharacterized mitochondrial protein AtMg00810-like [Telopea speciosissima]|uniref:uncharacterized mitochondrial protein AtMg00810-like n=1 Tax=Telopea speciosissima TaxID=54955 RepID=UPI001CC5C15E|nr:uncharacterized mitochondrial protein AtMg00810-like [Telopea speciosissima]